MIRYILIIYTYIKKCQLIKQPGRVDLENPPTYSLHHPNGIIDKIREISFRFSIFRRDKRENSVPDLAPLIVNLAAGRFD